MTESDLRLPPLAGHRREDRSSASLSRASGSLRGAISWEAKEPVFSQLVPRFPGLRPAVPVEELRIRSDSLTGGLVALPVEW
jgi:hypothetical protein